MGSCFSFVYWPWVAVVVNHSNASSMFASFSIVATVFQDRLGSCGLDYFFIVAFAVWCGQGTWFSCYTEMISQGLKFL